GADDLLDMGVEIAVLIVELGVLRPHLRAHVVFERFRVRVRVDEDPAAPAADLRARQLADIVAHAGEIPFGGDMLDLAVDRPGPAVEWAAELVGLLARAVAQLAAAVEAGVPMRLELVGPGADDEEGEMGDAIEIMVADFGDFLLAADHLPGLLPQPLDLEV